MLAAQLAVTKITTTVAEHFIVFLAGSGCMSAHLAHFAVKTSCTSSGFSIAAACTRYEVLSGLPKKGSRSYTVAQDGISYDYSVM